MAFSTSRARAAALSRTGSKTRREAIAAAALPMAAQVAGNPGQTNALNNSTSLAWQSELWRLYDKVPELRTACRISGQAMSQCRLILARVSSSGEPVPLDIGTPDNPGADANHPGVSLLAKFAGGLGGQSALLDLLGTHLTVPGEAIMVGKINPLEANPSDPFDRLQVYSTEQVRSRGKEIVVRIEESSLSDRVVLQEDGYDAIRIWRPHPRFTWEPDSAARSSMTVLREIAMYDDHIQATGTSRLAGRGILFVDENVTLPVSLAEEEPGEDGTQIDPFMELLMEVMSLAITDPSSAAAMVPILVRAADPEKAAKLLDFSTPFDESVEGKRESALKRFSVAVDMPPEILTGMGSLQHWTGALVTESWVNNYLPTLMTFVCGSLTEGWYLPALAEAGYGDMPADTIIWFDPSSVRTREDTGSEAQAAYDRGEISGDTYRRVLGFDDGDKPSLEEFLLQVIRTATLKGINPSPVLLAKLGFRLEADELATAEVLNSLSGAPPGGVAGPSASGEPSGVPSAPGTAAEPSTGVLPGTNPDAPVSAATLERMLRGSRR